MNWNRTKFLVLRYVLLVILTTTLFLGSFVIMQNSEIVDNVRLPEKSSAISYIPHDPILIDDDSDFISQGWPGYGNETHPYLIEGLEIMSNDYCISISGTTAHFAIVNCNLTFAGAFIGNMGIYLDSLENALVTNCIFYRFRSAIYCGYIQNSEFRNNTIEWALGPGLAISDSENITMVNNTASIHILRCSDCCIYQHYGGVRIESCLSCNVTNSDFEYGSISFSGDLVEHFLHNISDNTILGFPVVYMRDVSDQIVNPIGIGQLVFANCTNIQIMDSVAPIVHNNLAWIQLYFTNFSSITNNVIPECNYALIMWYSHNIQIEGNVIEYAHQTGLHIVDSTNCTITNNEFHNCMGALHSWGSNFNISYNIVDSCEAGLHAGPNCTMIGNVIWNCTYGIQLDDGWNIARDNIITTPIASPFSRGIDTNGPYDQLENNTISGFLVSIQLRGENCTLIDNTLVGKGLSLTGDTLWHWMHTMSGNTLDGQPLHYIQNQNGGVVDASGVSQLIVVNCTGLEIKNGVQDEQMSIAYCDHILLENNSVSDAVVGYLFENLTNSHIAQNAAINNQWGGFILRNFENCTVENNNATLHDSDGVGFVLQYGTNLTFSSNVATYNQLGIELHGVTNFTLESNIFSHSDIYGTYVYDCTNGTVTGNEITFNDHTGIYVQLSSGIILHGNEIGFNTVGNAKETYISNQWDDGINTGNAWSDYSGSGTYLIPGDTGSVDRYPRVLNDAPVIDPLGDIEYEDGSPTPLLNWTIHNLNPDSYLVFIDDSVFVSGLANESFIVVEIGELELGVHNITLYVNNTAGAYSVDTVFITVVDTTAPTITGLGDDVSWISDTSPNVLAWNAYDLNPSSYNILINGSEYLAGLWNETGETISANMDHLSVGHHNVTLVVVDVSGNYASYTVIATVTLGTTPTTITEFPIPMVLVIALGGVIVVIVILVMMRSGKR